MCRGEKYDGWPFISFGTEDVRFSKRDLIRPAGGSSMDQFEATITAVSCCKAIGLKNCLLLLDKAIVIPLQKNRLYTFQSCNVLIHTNSIRSHLFGKKTETLLWGSESR